MSTKNNRKIWLAGAIGAVVGFVLCCVLVFNAMPSLMIVTRECKLGFDETITTLEKRIGEHGWAIQGGRPIDYESIHGKAWSNL